MKTYKLPVSWQMYGYVEVTAESLEDAINIAENDSNLPDGDYIEGSFEVITMEQLNQSSLMKRTN